MVIAKSELTDFQNTIF